MGAQFAWRPPAYYPSINVRPIGRREAKSRAQINSELLARGIQPTYDPLVIGEHEVEPVRCPGCRAQIPWHIIKGWRN